MLRGHAASAGQFKSSRVSEPDVIIAERTDDKQGRAGGGIIDYRLSAAALEEYHMRQAAQRGMKVGRIDP